MECILWASSPIGLTGLRPRFEDRGRKPPWVNRHGQTSVGLLSDNAVTLVVKGYARAAEWDTTHYAGHRLRAGLATAATRAGRLGVGVYGADRPPERAHGPSLYSGWIAVPGERRGRGGLVEG